MPYISAENASFKYSERQDYIFDNISIDIDKGDIFYLLGPNGTGKSTLLKCVAGLLKIQHGKILIQGDDIYSLDPLDIAKKLSYVPQSHSSSFPFLVRDIVVMGRSPHIGIFSSPAEKDTAVAEKAMDTVGVTHLSARPCTNISGGEWQLVLIARALAQEPEILLLDEPTSHLDLGNQIKILNVIHDLAGRGLTIIIATHFPDHALIKSNKVAVLKNKKLLGIGLAENVITEENMKKAYSVDVKILHVDQGINRKLCVPVIAETKPG